MSALANFWWQAKGQRRRWRQEAAREERKRQKLLRELQLQEQHLDARARASEYRYAAERTVAARASANVPPLSVQGASATRQQEEEKTQHTRAWRGAEGGGERDIAEDQEMEEEKVGAMNEEEEEEEEGRARRMLTRVLEVAPMHATGVACLF